MQPDRGSKSGLFAYRANALPTELPGHHTNFFLSQGLVRDHPSLQHITNEISVRLHFVAFLLCVCFCK